MKRPVRPAVAVLATALLVGACGSAPPVTQTPEPTDSPVLTPTPELPAPTSSPTEQATPSPTPEVATNPPSPTPVVVDREYVSDDGQLTLLVPADAIADDLDLTAFARGQRDLPLELAGVEVRNAFYEIGPAGVEFAAPVRVERAARLKDLDIDLSTDGLPLLVPALRSSAAVWTWLDSPDLSVADRTLVVSGDAASVGLLFAFGGRASTTLQWSVPDRVVPIGSTFTLLVKLAAPEEEGDPAVLGSIAPVAAPGIVEAVSTSDSDGVAAVQEFRCVAAGEAPIGVSYSVSNLFADSALFGQFGLGPASTSVTVTETVKCRDAATPPPTPGPGETPDASPPSL